MEIKDLVRNHRSLNFISNISAKRLNSIMEVREAKEVIADLTDLIEVLSDKDEINYVKEARKQVRIQGLTGAYNTFEIISESYKENELIHDQVLTILEDGFNELLGGSFELMEQIELKEDEY